jgi:ribosomal protein S18 acetylase RimI-like enzyme
MIREYAKNDLQPVVEMLVKSRAINCAWLQTAEGVEKQLDEAALNLVYEEGKVLGCVSIDHPENKPTGTEIHTFLHTALGYRGKGIGSALWRLAWEYISDFNPARVFAGYREETGASRAFFAARGFTPRFISMRMAYSGGNLPDMQKLEAFPYSDPDFEQMGCLEDASFYEIRRTYDMQPLKPFGEASPEERQEMRQELLADRENLFLFRNGGDLVGYARITDFIDDIGVAPKWQGHGYGTEILRFCVNELRRRGVKQAPLYVLDGNLKARRLYEKCGFMVTDEIESAVWHRQ